MYINVDEDQIVTLDFSSYNSSRILDQFKKWNDKKKVYDENDIKKIEESLDMLGNVTKGFEVEANIDEVYVDEDATVSIYEITDEISKWDNKPKKELVDIVNVKWNYPPFKLNYKKYA